MRLVKLTLFGLIVASLTMMWSNRAYVTEAYEPSQDTMQVRLSGVDLAVTRSEIAPSPFLIPAAPDTRRAALPALTRPEPILVEELPGVEMTGGEARLSGTVSGPDGRVAGATVSIERHTSHGVGSLLVPTNQDGVWTVGELPGGRYRVRSWLPGLMTTGGSEVRYVEDEEKSEFEFSMWGVDPTPSLEFITGGSIYQGQTGQVAFVLTRRYIDANGILVTTPVPGGLISVEVTPEVTVASSPTQLTGIDGVARFTIGCTGVNPGATTQNAGTITARSGQLVSSFALPGCRPVPIPEPAPAPAPIEPDPAQVSGQDDQAATNG